MAGVAEVIFTAIVGAIGGLIGNAINERLKSDVGLVDIELSRLETFEDDLLDVLDSPPDEPDRRALLRRLNVARRRLGVNIKSKVLASDSFARCERELTRLTDFIEMAEDGKPLNDELEVEIHSATRRLAGALRSATRSARAFAFFRGSAP